MSTSPPQATDRIGFPPTPPTDEDGTFQTVASVLRAAMEVLRKTAPGLTDPLQAEMLGSDAAGIWWSPTSEPGAGGAELERRVGRAYSGYLEHQADRSSLAALRALQLGGSDEICGTARAAAERLVRGGVADPAWWAAATVPLRPVRAVRFSEDDDPNRPGVLFLEFERAGRQQTLGMLVGVERIGVISGVGVFTGIEALESTFRGAAEASGARDSCLRPVTVANARDEMLRAIERTDLLGPLEDTCRGYTGHRGLAQRWLEIAGTYEGGGDASPAALAA